MKPLGFCTTPAPNLIQTTRHPRIPANTIPGWPNP